MIDFACKRIELEEIIRCGLGISRSEYSLIRFMLKHYDQWFSSKQLSRSMNLDKSTLQRSLKKLYENEVLSRKQKNLDTGGYIFVYQAKDKKEIAKKIANIIEAWTSQAIIQIKNW